MTTGTEAVPPKPSRNRPRVQKTRLMTALWLLLPAMGLSACAHAAPPQPVIPDSLLEYPAPKPYPDPASATQADLTAALADTYFAWEETAANLTLVKTLLKKKDQ